MNIELVVAIRAWRLAQSPPLSHAAAVDVLLRRALAADAAGSSTGDTLEAGPVRDERQGASPDRPRRLARKNAGAASRAAMAGLIATLRNG